MSLAEKYADCGEEVLCECIHGSRLYGTFSENSDYDYKVLYLPALERLLLGHPRALAVFKERPEGINENDTMPEGLPETEFIPIQKFAFDFYEGQTYALELAFAIKQGLAVIEEDVCGESWLKPFVDELLSRFLTSDVSKMVGYSMHQAQVYGLKGERLRALESVYFAILNEIQESPRVGDTRLLDFKELLTPLQSENIIFTVIDGKNPEATGKECIQINDKQFDWSCPLTYFLDSLQKIMKQYGSRTRLASKDSVDWKALSHAVRISYQAAMLLESGKIEFPIGIAGTCRAIKSGELSYMSAVGLFADIADGLEHLRKMPTVLPEKTVALTEEFNVFLSFWMIHFYMDKY